MSKPRLALPNSAKRIAKALGFSGAGMAGPLPNTLREFARLLGKVTTRASYPTTLEGLQKLIDGASDIGATALNALQLDGENLQLAAEDLTLGA